MAPRIIQFESEGEQAHITNQAWALCNSFDSVTMPGKNFAPRLLAVIPDEKEVEPPKTFDPPPWAA